MPELPEVEVVRSGLERLVTGARFERVTVLHDRAVRRHEGPTGDLIARLEGRRIDRVRRRGKYLWIDIADGIDEPPAEALVVHLGMSGQMLVDTRDRRDAGSGVDGRDRGGDDRHLRIRAELSEGRVLRFVDQRTFGGWLVAPLVVTDDDPTDTVPEPIAHIARDPLDPRYDIVPIVPRIRRRHSDIKRVLLDQTVVSGIGNIYADEALWRAELHGERSADRLTARQIVAVMGAAGEVMGEALARGGTSFDSLYVNVNGESGYFERELAVYGREDLACRRCGAPIRRERFMNRSSYSCPKCQVRPRRR
ncbi:bifunctional DNA-formamidopyrimidine glycosylase/DNA-(apurinic or apyrimidinic site) lyase [Millisia brevis]|uniref:bifunctional DNA-formamidopyrimidine glycosylase/DNA-(apurinic or apyrimidinic site) lyase n=1 Tax=Millisia brevis TaxID=264148 RepID=UPI00082C9A16|nr:bifunctional DNA-formamidopyrimidine glycosylase/DNA-(apurinic or apyrimidinic site) lyase [Millisia brevis]